MIFFLQSVEVSVPSVNPSVIIFFYYQRIYRHTKNYWWKIHRQSISVGDFVDKLITDVICVLRRWKNSVRKTVKCCSVFDMILLDDKRINSSLMISKACELLILELTLHARMAANHWLPASNIATMWHFQGHKARKYAGFLESCGSLWSRAGAFFFPCSCQHTCRQC